MSKEEPTPYAYAPTKSGTKFPWQLGEPNPALQIAADVESDSADEDGEERLRYTVPLDFDETPVNYPQGEMFRRRYEKNRDNNAGQQCERQRQEPEQQPERVAGEHGGCFCGRCIDMPTAVERKCCAQEELDNTCLADYVEGQCLLECEDIKHCISPVTVRHSWLNQQRFFGLTGEALLFGNMTNKNYRHHAYRCYVNYIYGLLGRYNRKVIPACVIAEVRRQWPDPNGNYRGFVQVNNEGTDIQDETAEIPFGE